MIGRVLRKVPWSLVVIGASGVTGMISGGFGYQLGQQRAKHACETQLVSASDIGRRMEVPPSYYREALIALKPDDGGLPELIRFKYEVDERSFSIEKTREERNGSSVNKGKVTLDRTNGAITLEDGRVVQVSDGDYSAEIKRFNHATIPFYVTVRNEVNELEESGNKK